MIAYADASAFVKRYRAEQGSDLTRGWFAAADQVACCRLGFIEVWRAIAQLPVDVSVLHHAFELDWTDVRVVEIDADVTRAAATLAVAHGLRSLDALHLAAAETVAGPDLRVITWDRRLWQAARALGLVVLPVTEP